MIIIMYASSNQFAKNNVQFRHCLRSSLLRRLCLLGAHNIFLSTSFSEVKFAWKLITEQVCRCIQNMGLVFVGCRLHYSALKFIHDHRRLNYFTEPNNLHISLLQHTRNTNKSFLHQFPFSYKKIQNHHRHTSRSIKQEISPIDVWRYFESHFLFEIYFIRLPNWFGYYSIIV